jgi:hypothetical protein
MGFRAKQNTSRLARPRSLNPGAFYYFSDNEEHEVRNVGNENAMSLEIFTPQLEQVLSAWRARKGKL